MGMWSKRLSAFGCRPSVPGFHLPTADSRKPRTPQRGVTLVELVVSITIFAIALLAILTFMATSIGRSADPMVQEQASAIARAYLEEVSRSSFCDPSYDPDGDPATGCPVECTTSVCAGGCGGPIGGAETRSTYDDICDYDGLVDNGARNQFDQPLPGLESYTVSVRVLDSGIDLGGLQADAGRSARIDVTVGRAGMDAVTVSGWRVNN
ncbi:MAG: type II secretion system protein [Gammaproteobacteria bacterium]|nr:MAG: type II secretion system protein [Gammaproteobacteria bacterium]